MNPAAQKLKEISTLDSLITFLRDEMGWPIETDNFEDVVFEYSAEELGIDEASAAKIDSIRRLQPLTVGQPWGVFFVEFEPRKLPVTALRRILNEVVTKKRATKADQTTWDMEDLMFISSVGEGTDRAINFAHFSRGESGRLPSLKVIAWDSDDTPLHMEDVADKLTEKLAWPADGEDTDTWQQAWSSAFTLRHNEVITTSQMLAGRLAELAKDIRGRILKAVQVETSDGPVTTLMESFREILIHDLNPGDFADMYAQTITYGLLSAHILNTGHAADNSSSTLPVTNPFLRDLMQELLCVGGVPAGDAAAIDFDELGINEVIDLLETANMEAVVSDFGNRNPNEDPVIRFYEQFLAEYNAELRMRRGVFYTPQPVVSFIVRAVDESLRHDFGLEDGLADTATWAEVSDRLDVKVPDSVSPSDRFVKLLDPATGTGTFLVEAIGLIHDTMTNKWLAKGATETEVSILWNRYVPEDLLPRLYGFELLMAPYAIAHLKVGLKLLETGYRFNSPERARIFLTNSLEPPVDLDSQFEFALPALAHEATAVNRVKGDSAFTVVVGNPPYSGISANANDWIDGLLRGHRQPGEGSPSTSFYHVNGRALGERKLWLQDDYVKFIRLAQWHIAQSGIGVTGLITNHGYLDNPTFRGMRESLLSSFQRIAVTDLHGNLLRRENAASNLGNENVFDIQQGVAIGIFTRNAEPKTIRLDAEVRHRDVWGTRADKYSSLATSPPMQPGQRLSPASPFYLFVPFDDSEVGSYASWHSIAEVMPVNVTGVVTARDAFVIDFDDRTILDRIGDLRGDELTDAEIRTKYFSGKGSKKYPAGDSRSWKLAAARSRIRSDDSWDQRCAPILYRPFDERRIYYVPWMVDWPRSEAMPHLLAGDNIGLIFMRQVAMGDSYTHFGVSRNPVDARAFYSNKGIMSIAPLWLYDLAEENTDSLAGRSRRANLATGFVDALEKALIAPSDNVGHDWLTPESTLSYIYAVFGSPEYRRRFEPMLKLDFPRIPIPTSRAVFTELAALGQQLITVHLLEFDSNVRSETAGQVTSVPISRVGWLDQTIWLDAEKVTAKDDYLAVTPGSAGIAGISEEVWRFRLGGYQVLHKWLKDRKGRVLSDSDLLHLSRTAIAIRETQALWERIDATIDELGGWEIAFASSEDLPPNVNG